MEQKLKIKCPHCGWVRTLEVGVYAEAGAASVTRGLGDELQKAAEKLKKIFSNEAVEAANAWLDLPACPECRQPYRYNVRTREVKP